MEHKNLGDKLAHFSKQFFSLVSLFNANLSTAEKEKLAELLLQQMPNTTAFEQLP